MGLDTELDFEKYCQVVEIPKLGHFSHRHNSKAEERNEKGKPTARSSLSSLGGKFTEISFNKSLSSSCKSMSCGPSVVSGNEAFKRGSVYQSSREVRRMKTMGTFEVREKIELSYRTDTSPSFRIIDSLSQPDNEVNPLVEKKSELTSCNGGSNPKSLTFIEPDTSLSLHSAPRCVTNGDVSSDGFFEIRMASEDREQCSAAETIVRGSMVQTKFRCDQTMGPQNDGNGSLERDTVFSLHKSSSEKLGMHYSPCRSESDQYSKASSKIRFSHFRQMLDPFMKSKSLRSPSVSAPYTSEEVTTIKRSKTLSKSLLNDFSNTSHEKESGAQFVVQDHCLDLASSSPAHLHGLLKLELKHGVPFFEFSLKDPEDFLAAKTWRADSAFNWVYTFHSMNSRRKSSNRSPWGAKEKQKDDSMVGQMQVSSYLCSELQENGALDNSMVTEFVLYDVAHTRKSFHGQESSECSTDSTKPASKGTQCESQSLAVGDLPLKSKDVPHDQVNHKLEFRHSSGNNDDSCATMSYPWAPADLHPNLEITGIVIQVPFEKRESLKGGKREDKVGVDYSPSLLDFSGVDRRSDEVLVPGRRRSLANVKVVIPSGTHGLPTTKEGGGGGPSPLLDRWRSSGGCDCGGWDMACPLLVLDSPGVQNMAGGHLLMDNKQPLELFVQGAKEMIPALTIKPIDDGQYSVDFHAQLSKLQAFSICVAFLHSSEVSTTAVVGHEKDEKQRLQCNSLKVLLEEEVRFLIEAVAEGEKRKMTKRIEEHPPSFVLNPPFSPIARV
ncbi:Protein of unknown function DUF3527 [Macleaya cordata]|uniref:Uncharacterized protein n=1 Tax=Macleaya cordata TaxID=56857 RepID=A0A200R0W2_MACCD|nr:Protein of unknown function DUF3527 [Macleaya cordata]